MVWDGALFLHNTPAGAIEDHLIQSQSDSVYMEIAPNSADGELSPTGLFPT